MRNDPGRCGTRVDIVLLSKLICLVCLPNSHNCTVYADGSNKEETDSGREIKYDHMQRAFWRGFVVCPALELCEEIAKMDGVKGLDDTAGINKGPSRWIN